MKINIPYPEWIRNVYFCEAKGDYPARSSKMVLQKEYRIVLPV